jgi:hypothetical protein
VKIDLTFADIPHELMLLKEYIELLENHLPALVQAEKGRIWAEATNSEDPDVPSSYVASHLEALLDDGITTRFLTGSAFIAVWAIYEASVRRFAEHLAKRQGAKRMPGRNGSFVQRAKRYFGQDLRFPLHDPATDWERLEKLAKIRHALAHANGRLEDVQNQADVKLLRTMVKSGLGLSLVDDYLVLSLPFVRESLDFVDGLITALQERVEAIAKSG